MLSTARTAQGVLTVLTGLKGLNHLNHLNVGRAVQARYMLAAIGIVLFLSAGPAPSEIRFQETASAWGLDFRHHSGGSGKRYYPETDGSGVVVLDYDFDGDPDVLFVDSAPLPGYEGAPTGSVLYRNDGSGRFVDVTGSSGLHQIHGYGMGGSAADYDNDGDLDLYVTHFRANQLFRNRGDGTFVDATDAAGVGDDLWSMSSAFADLDRDGDLDLYVTNYIDYPIDNPTLCFNEMLGVGAFCHPELFEPLPDRLYVNRGDGTFVDGTIGAGLAGRVGKAMGVVVTDLDNDDWLDLYVANDTTPNSLFRNLGDGTFEDASLLSGTAFGDTGLAEAGMGVAAADVDEDGWIDLYVTNFALETNALYRNLGSGVFVDARTPFGVAQPSLVLLGFGTVFADFDFDADIDLAIANGHILDNVELMEEREDLTYRQPNQVMENLGGGKFKEVEGSGLGTPAVSRGLATADLDRDGDIDLLITNSNDVAEVYENRTGDAGNWLAVELGETSGGAAAYGSRLVLTTPGRRQSRDVFSSDSYLSRSEPIPRFGLGSHDGPSDLAIRWADGRRSRFLELPVGRRYRVIPPEPATR